LISAASDRPRRALELTLLALAATALAFQLLVPPILGIADNGDFSRVAEPLGIFPPEDAGAAAYFGWILPEYRFDAKRIWLHGLCCYSSQTLFGVAAVPMGLVISPPGRFRLEAMGIVNAIGLLAAFFVLLIALRPLGTRAQALGGALVLLAFTDGAYASYLNTFYTEPATLIFFLGSVGLAILLAERPRPPVWLLPGFFLCAALLATSRPQNAMLGVLFALLGIRLVWSDRDRSRRRFAVAAAVGLCVVSFAYFRNPPGPLGKIHLFNAVFRELLVGSPDPHGDLAALGLAPELDRYVGLSGFSPDAPIVDDGFRRNFYGRIGYGKLASFYAARPKRVWRALDRSASHAFEIRPLRLGNYPKEAGKPAGAVNWSLALWSRAKERFLPAHLGFVMGFLIVSLAAALATRLRAHDRAARLASEVWIAVILVAAFQFSVSSVMDHESRRSLFLFNASWDVLFITLVTGTMAALTHRARERGGREAGLPSH
jgi:hypothetical protein